MSGSDLTGHGAGHGHEDEGFVNLPTPTIWPFVFALGVSLLIAGMVTHWVISLLGVCMALPAIAGWFRQIFPHEAGLHLFQIHAVTEGTDAQAEVTVRLEEAGKLVTGQAADTDTLVASAQAYIAALNRLVTKREKTAPAALSA